MLADWPRHVDLSPPAADSLGEDGSDAVQSGDGRRGCVWVERGGGGGRIVHKRGVVRGHILREGGHASVRACGRAGVRVALGFAPDAGVRPASGAGRLLSEYAKRSGSGERSEPHPSFTRRAR